MSDTAPELSSVGPFQPQPARKRSFLDVLRRKSRDADARAALETRLAEQGLDSVNPEYVQSVLNSFGLSGQTARSVLMSLWEQALKELLYNDNKLDAAENAYLDQLEHALGLTDAEVAALQSKAVQRVFIRRAEYLLREDDAVSSDVRDAIAQEARNLRISQTDEELLLREPARRTLAATLQRIFIGGRVSDDEVKNILKFLDDYHVMFETEELNKFSRCFNLSVLDRGILPHQKIDITLEPGEQCGFAGPAQLYEMRKVRRSGVSTDQLQEIDKGTLCVTNKRILFIGGIQGKTIDLAAITNVFGEQTRLVVQKRSGKNHYFTFNDNLDAEAALKTIQLIRSGVAATKGKDRAEEQLGTASSTATGTPPAESARRAPEKTSSGVQSRTAAQNVEQLLNKLDALTGLEPVKRELRSLVNYLRVQRLRVEQGLPSGQLTVHLVFTGNPGTGKTTVARLLAKIYKAMGFLPEGHLVETDRSGLIGGYLGQTAIKTAEVIKKAFGGVLFIDEAYALTRAVKGQEGDTYGSEAIDTLLKAMEDNRDQLVVIVAGYTAPMRQFLTSNPGLQSRFTRFIDFPDYSPKELVKIFNDMTSSQGYTLADDALERASDLLEQAYQMRDERFGNARLVRTMFERATVRLSDRLAQDVNITREELTTIRAEDIQLVRENC